MQTSSIILVHPEDWKARPVHHAETQWATSARMNTQELPRNLNEAINFLYTLICSGADIAQNIDRLL